jgi:arylsulfatase A-like enzyme
LRPASCSRKPNILVIWGDDIGQSNISAYTHGMMGYQTPNIDRIANEGMTFTDYYGEQSCTAGRSSFITGQSVFRTGLSKVGLPGAELGLRVEDPTTIAGLLKASATPPASSARTTSATATSTCRPTTASTSSSATSTT